MSVKCRREDRQRFEAMGFQIAWGESENSPVIEMVDEEANYAHYGKMPTDIPYYGTWSAGCEYGPGSLVCDGKDYEEVPASTDGFVMLWSYRWGLPALKSILQVRRYVKLERKVEKLFARLLEPQHLFSPHTNCCVKCGIHADDDVLENQPCKK
jgi:hypothetical protein